MEIAPKFSAHTLSESLRNRLATPCGHKNRFTETIAKFAIKLSTFVLMHLFFRRQDMHGFLLVFLPNAQIVI